MSPTTEPLPVKDLDKLLSETTTTTTTRDILVKHVNWRPLTEPGENFGSVILAIDATIEVRDHQEEENHQKEEEEKNHQKEEEKNHEVSSPPGRTRTEVVHLVAKLPPRLEYLLELFNSPVTFRKELIFYERVVTELVNLQRESGIAESDLCTIAPMYLGGRLGHHQRETFDLEACILLENLKIAGYVTEDRVNGVDLEHARFAVRELARMHGITVALKIKKPDYFEDEVLPVLRQEVSETAIKCVNDMVRKTVEDLKDVPEAKGLLARAEKTIVHGSECYGRPTMAEEPWATLVHNDFWVNNMMYRHDEVGRILDMKIVDFQLCTYDSGLCDLIFFLASSVRNEVLDDCLDDLVDLYYESFLETLQGLNVDTGKFQRRRFDEMLNVCGPVKFVQCMMMIQVIQATRDDKKGETRSVEADANGPEDIFVSQAGNEACKRKMLHVLRTFERKGWLLQ